MKKLIIPFCLLALLSSCKVTNYNTYNTSIYIGSTTKPPIKASDKVWQRYKESQYNKTPIKAMTVEEMKASEDTTLDSLDFAQPQRR